MHKFSLFITAFLLKEYCAFTKVYIKFSDLTLKLNICFPQINKFGYLCEKGVYNLLLALDKTMQTETFLLKT